MKWSEIRILLSFIPFLFLEGCTTTDSDTYINTYRFINESGVEVALVGEPNDNFGMPDSLVLSNRESKECFFGYNSFSSGLFPNFPYKGYNNITEPYTNFPIKIYFDKKTCVIYYDREDDIPLRNPFSYGEDHLSYVKTKREEKNKKYIKTIYTYTYTFTAADYQSATKGQN